MTSYLRKYITALASAKDYLAEWSSEHVYADEELIVPFPTFAIFNSNKNIWSINIKAWIYLPLQAKSLTDYLPSLPNFLKGNKTNENKDERKDSKETENEKQVKTETKDEQPKSKESKDEKQVKNETKDEEKEKSNNENKEEKLNEGISNTKKEKDGSNNEESDTDDDLYQDALDGEFGVPEENPGRLSLFFAGNSVKIITKSIINGVEHLLQPSDESGFIEECIELPDNEVQSLSTAIHSDCGDKKFEYEIKINQSDDESKTNSKENDYRLFNCTIYVPAKHGISVISDIDDTIKVSNVLSKRLLLKHTFYSYFKPIEGMNELYQKWQEQKCLFHYVSASPWQLYPALRCFLEKYQFPMGTMNLRKFTWNLEFFKSTETYKIESISEIIDAFPLRKYICVGDSGELDPEIYAKLYIKYPKSIVHIFIRDVSQTSTPDERFEKAFKDIPKQCWTVFKDPNKIETDIKKLI